METWVQIGIDSNWCYFKNHHLIDWWPCDLKWPIREKNEKDHKDCFNSTPNVNYWSFTNMMVIFALSSWYFVCFALWLHVHTFMEVEEMWAFNLFVLLVSSQISLSSFYLLLMTNHEVLPLVGLIYFIVVGNFKSSYYKEQMFVWAKGLRLF